MGLLFLRPDESFHGREIARRAGFPAGTLTRELKRLAEAGLLQREARGNQILYRANRASPVFDEIASIVRKTSGFADELKRALEPPSCWGRQAAELRVRIRSLTVALFVPAS